MLRRAVMLSRARWALGFGLLSLLGGCRDYTVRAQRAADAAGFNTSIVQGTRFTHQVFDRLIPGADLIVFVEGDGSPWIAGGSRIAEDPTPHNALALRLATHTPGSIVYVGRPCYFTTRNDAACNPAIWSSARFSVAVIESMAAVVSHYADITAARRVVLIGYSGGGALAALMAPHVPRVVLVTIAADLDTDAWTRLHGYTRLEESLNPAAQPGLAPRIAQWHLVGDRDENVPFALNQRYWERIAADHVWHFPRYDHVCCWAQHWPMIWARIDQGVSSLDDHDISPPSD